PRQNSAHEAREETMLGHLLAGGKKLNLFGGGMELPEAPPAEPEPLPGFARLLPAEQEAWLAPFRNATNQLAALPDREEAAVATQKLLAAMGRAFYAPDNQGHFGLASTHYCHFTSPIRRYPDLVVHRNLKWLIAGRSGMAPHAQEALRAMCDHCSEQEGAAAALERRIKASCLVLATLDASSTTASARITGITPTSLFVLRGDGIEARIPVRTLPGGPYDADPWESMLMEGERDLEGASPEELRRLQAMGIATREAPRVRARLAERVTVRLAERDVAAGRTGAQLLEWG
ncbi:MAG: RNB domain-containing ribonuclease, partial [Thermoplasmatota archaeon]